MIKFDQIARATMKLLAIAGGGVTLFSSAFAGHYVVKANTLTSGLIVEMNPGSWTGPIYGPGSCSVPSAGGGQGAGSISGELTTTYTWVRAYENEPAPESVVVIETCLVDASARAYPSGSPSASAYNGLSGPLCVNDATSGPINIPIPVAPFYVTIGQGAGAYSYGIAARIIEGGDEIVVTCSPTADCASGNGPYSASLDYFVDVYPVTVNVSGTKVVDHEHKILPGQYCDAALSVGAPDVSAESWNWSVTGKKFKDYVATENVGYVWNVPHDEWELPNPWWRWKVDDGIMSVECSTELFYSGTSIGSATAKQDVNLLKVVSSLVLAEGDGQAELDASVSGLTLYPSSYSTDNSRFEPAMYISFGAVTPAEFVENGQGGSVSYMQLAKMLYSKTINGTTTPIMTTNGAWMLDQQFPYAGPNNAGTQPYTTNDRPRVTLAGAIAATTPVGSSFGANYLDIKGCTLFMAPGNARYTPLLTAPWHWNAKATRQLSDWFVDSDSSITKGATEPLITHPVWNACIKGIN